MRRNVLHKIMERRIVMITFKNQISRETREKLNEHFKLAIKQDESLYILFLIMGADVQAGCGMAMREKATKGDFRAVKILYHFGAKLEDALEISVRKADIVMARYLLKKGSKTYAWFLNDAINNEDMEMIQLLLEYKIEISPRAKKELNKFGLEVVT